MTPPPAPRPAADAPPAAERPKLTQTLQAMESALANAGAPGYGTLAARAEGMYRSGKSQFSLLTGLLSKAKEHIGFIEGEWRGSTPKNGVLDIEWCLEFYRVWSAIQFAYCMPDLNDLAPNTRYGARGNAAAPQPCRSLTGPPALAPDCAVV